jgi:UDP-3-O-[3-hydroxymyristoyl] glucosamine N-acyltransferase
MNKRQLLIFGLGDIAEVAHDCFESDTDYEVIGHVVHEKYMPNKHQIEFEVFPFENIGLTHPCNEYSIFIALGYKNLNYNKKLIYNLVKEKGYCTPNYIHSNAVIMTDKIGENNFVLENAVIQARATIGNNNLIGAQSLIGHHSEIKNHNYIGSTACLCGHNKIGSLNFVGSKSVTAGHVTIGDSNYIGPSCKVFNNLNNDEVLIERSTDALNTNYNKIQNVLLKSM